MATLYTVMVQSANGIYPCIVDRFKEPFLTDLKGQAEQFAIGLQKELAPCHVNAKPKYFVAEISYEPPVWPEGE